MNNDTLSRIICEELNLRAYTVTTKNAVSSILAVHETTPNASVALGRSINAALLLGASLLKPDSAQSLTFRIDGSGPLKGLTVQCDAKGNVRANVVNPIADITDDIGEISFGKAIGAGVITVSKYISEKEPYTSVSPLVYGEVAKDTAYYLTMSEQIPSALILALKLDNSGKVLSSGGILIQTLPDTPEETIAAIEKNISSMPKSLSELLADGGDIHFILSELFNRKKLDILSSTDITHNCRCSKETIEKVLHSLKAEDLEKMILEDKGAEVVCSFCNKKYQFSVQNLDDMMKRV